MRLPTFCRHFLSRVQVIKYCSDGSLDSIIKSTSMYEEVVYNEKKK